MSVLDALLLALIQVFTEFLPVSSSGHLVIAQKYLGIHSPNVTFNVLVHLGTLIAIIAYFSPRLVTILNAAEKELDEDVFGPSAQLLTTILLANIPAVFVGYFFNEEIEQLFTGGITPCFMFLITALVLYMTRYARTEDGFNLFSIPLSYGLIVGVAQAFAIIPGISRSGFTISFALFLMIAHEDAATFSFLLSIPVITGAAVMKLGSVDQYGLLLSGPYLLGFFVSVFGGFLALALLMFVIRRKQLHLFSYYLVAVGITGLFVFS